jgi:hypothetical protein
MLYKTLFISVLSTFALVVNKGTAAEQRHAEAHVHGVAEIDIVVGGKRVIVEFRTPTEGLMGFEHEARTDAERKKRDAAMKIINDRFNELVILDKKIGCTWRTIKARIVRGKGHDTQNEQREADNRKQSGEHSEVQATHTFECERSPVGTKATFGVSKLFPNIHEIKVQVLSEAKQLGVTIKKDKGEIEL